jgi:hypothetical protein
MLTNVPRKYLAAIGFGVDAFHGVSHALFLENVSNLIKTGGFLGTFSLIKEMKEVSCRFFFTVNLLGEIISRCLSICF